MDLKDASFLLKELRSNECACSRSKQPGHSFCYHDYSSLPPNLQRNLYKRFGAGYEESYEEAFEWLKENEWE